jgi:twitching motility two-component system response regulator PilH
MEITNANKEKHRILIIDDDEMFCHMYKTLLEETGRYQVETINNGHDGILFARCIEPDLILLDVLMPEMNGYDVSRALSRYDDTKHIPYIFVTSTLSEQGSVIKITNHYIKKPIDVEDLISAIEETIKHGNLKPPRLQ